LGPDIQDPEGLRRYAVQARRLGFTGMSLIHPGQIDTINAVFSPSREEVEYAEQVVKAFDDATARGDGALFAAAFCAFPTRSLVLRQTTRRVYDGVVATDEYWSLTWGTPGETSGLSMAAPAPHRWSCRGNG
jgi:hypothetical protein